MTRIYNEEKESTLSLTCKNANAMTRLKDGIRSITVNLEII